LMCPDFAIYGFIYMKKKSVEVHPSGRENSAG
jgi:hypothetical protein